MLRSIFIWIIWAITQIFIVSINLIAASVLIGTGAAAYLFWQVKQGAQLFDAMTPWLVDRVNSAAVGFDLSVGGVDIATSDAGLYLIQLKDVVIRQSSTGTVVATVPSAEVGFSVLDLFRGRVTVSSLDLVGAAVRVIRQKDGEYALGLSDKLITVNELHRWLVGEFQADDPFSQDNNTSSFALDVGLKRSVLTFDDRLLDRVIAGHIDNAFVSTTAGANGATIVTGGKAEINLSSSQGKAEIELGLVSFGEGGLLLSAHTKQVRLEQVASLLSVELPAFAVDLQVSSEARYVIDGDGSVPVFVMRISGEGSGIDVFPSSYPGLKLDNFFVEVSGDSLEMVNINRGEFLTNRGKFSLSGRVAQVVTARTDDKFTEDEIAAGNAPVPISVIGKMQYSPTSGDLFSSITDELVFNLVLDGKAQHTQDNIEPQISQSIDIFTVASSQIEQDANTSSYNRVDIKALSWRVGSGSWTIVGEIGLDEEQGYVNLQGEVSNFFMPELYAPWPADVLPVTQAWLQDNLRTCEIINGTLFVNIPPEVVRAERKLSDSEFNLSFDYRNLALSYITGMPELINGSGHAELTGNKFITKSSAAQIEIDGGRRINIGESTFLVNNLSGDDHVGVLTLNSEGRLLPVLQLVDMEPLGLLSENKVSPEQFGGRVSLRLDMEFPLDSSKGSEEIVTNIVARVTDASVRGLFDYKVSNGEFDISITSFGITGSGKGMVDGLPMDISWRKPFNRNEEQQLEEYQFSGQFNNQWRKKFKIDLLPGAIDGVLGLDLDMTFKDRKLQRMVLRFDATQVRIRISPLLFKKKRGVAASGIAVLRRETDDIARIQNFTAIGDNFTISGYGEYDMVNGEVISLQFEDARWSGNRLSGEIIRRDSKTYDAFIVGKVIDARPFMANLGISERMLEEENSDLAALVLSEQNAAREQINSASSDGLPEASEDAPPSWRVFLTLERVFGYSASELKNVTGGLEFVGGELKSATMRGRFPNETGVGMVLRAASVASNNRQRMVIDSDDGGAVLKGLGFYDKIKGGSLKIDMLLRNESHLSIDGTLSINNFRVVGEKSLDDLLQESEQSNQDSNSAGIIFGELVVPFYISEETAYIDKLRMNNQSVGITLSGQVDRLNDTMSMVGTFTPLYAINTLVGQLPILGELLTGGGEGEGVFGIVFALSGEIENPTLQVNPVSAIAPGAFRRLFGGTGRDN